MTRPDLSAAALSALVPRLLVVAAAMLLLGAVPAGGVTTVDGAAASLVGTEVAVACVDLEEGFWGAATVGLAYIQLDHDICAALAAAPRLRRGYLTRPSSGASVLTLAHEAAHVRGVEDEREADCFGMANLQRTALALGFRRTQLRTLRAQAQAVSECG